MKRRDFSLAAASLGLLPLVSHAQARAPKAGTDYIVLGTLQMPRVLGIEPLEAQQDGVMRWREGMRKLFNGLAESSS